MKVVLKPWPGLKDSLDVFSIQIEQEIKRNSHTNTRTDKQMDKLVPQAKKIGS